MNDNVQVRDQAEYEEYVAEDEALDGGRREEVRVVRDHDGEHSERVVENFGAERRAMMNKVSGLIWLAGGLLEALIGMRFLLKLIAANPDTPFVSLIYSLSDLFLWPFAGLTATPAANGMVLEISSLVAMLVYAILTWAAVRLFWLLFSPTESRRVSVHRREQL
jgi:hypothetical protein